MAITDILIRKADAEEALKSSTIPFAGVAMAPAPEGAQTDDADTWARYRLVDDSARTITPEHARRMLRGIRRLMTIHSGCTTPNWVIVKELFCCGSTSAREWCQWAEVDPDKTW